MDFNNLDFWFHAGVFASQSFGRRGKYTSHMMYSYTPCVIVASFYFRVTF